MLKTTLLAVATALISSSALAYDQADRDAPLGILVPEPGVYIALPGEAPPDPAPQVVETPAPSSDWRYQRPVHRYTRTFISQPAQAASVRTK